MVNWAKMDEVKLGDILIADGGFTCLKNKAELLVKERDGILYVDCAEGGHDLDGQINENDEYVGFTKKS